MEELQLKYVEIAFDKKAPQEVDTEINILGRIENALEELEYKFIVGKGGLWNTIQEFSDKNECIWKPKEEGEYMVMIQAREKDGKKPLDYLAKEEYYILKGEVTDTMHKEVSIETAVNAEEVNIEYKDIVDKEQDNLLILDTAESTSDSDEFKEVIANKDDNLVLFEIKELTKAEKDILIGSAETKQGKISSNDKEVVNENEINSENSSNIIHEIIIDKDEISVGDKCSIEVITNNEEAYLYRIYAKRYNEWSIVRDYDTSNLFKYTANEQGEKEFLIQCKRMESTESFEDYRVIKIKVKASIKIEITNFKCLSKLLLVGEKLEFLVETNVEKTLDNNDQVLLYKFYKIFKDGKAICIQDYSTKNHVYYKETQAGSYRILCLAKSIFSNKEYDDRAILVYNVKPYKEVKINSFVANYNSPQVTETEIKFSSEVQGGTNLQYRYRVNGTIEYDTGYTEKNEFTWTPIEAGEYEIILSVKDASYKEEYEDIKKIAFTIEKKGKTPVKILDVVVDKEKKIITGEPVNIMVNAEGGTHLQYAFTIRKDKRRLEGGEFNKANWINFIPKQVGEYEVEIMLKDRYSDKPYDAHTVVYLKAMEYLPGEIDYIIMPYKETHLIGEPIEFECIIQNTQNVLVKYETKINGNSVEKTEFSRNKKLRFTPKIVGKYTIEVYAKNLKCKNEYDSKKEISLYVSEAPPVIETKIIANKLEANVNEELTFEVISRGGKDVCYEFYLMENNEWRKVQAYSRKHYYSFMPFVQGKHKILALAKSYYKKASYEDYDEITFYVKG
ncbi:triple tyrosine motif-containing protein [Clostridium sp. YIM B02555]|jgi:hypothetical protein|uniref:triple tyrosine motif-containing protein n=1 Tax=Clostridium sp. YIM B02555 TaxID=2911968 RepID=UPI001EEF7743|nr:triple tyrosine motif-containing protein [Clostridium sp. YIM B02555]